MNKPTQARTIGRLQHRCTGRGHGVRIAATILLGFTAACPSGLGGAVGGQAAPVSEPLPSAPQGFAFQPAPSLVDPNTGAPTSFSDESFDVRVIGGIGTVAFASFSTLASADDADGAGTPLDPEAPIDDNDQSDVFVSAMDTQGAVLDTVLVSRDYGGTIASNGSSARPDIDWLENPSFVATDPTNTNPAGWLFVAFDSTSTDVASVDNNAFRDVFQALVEVRVGENPATGAAQNGALNLRAQPFNNRLISASAGGGQAAGDCYGARVSGYRDFESGYLAAIVAFEADALGGLGLTDSNGAAPDVLIKEFGPGGYHHFGEACSDCHCWRGEAATLSVASHDQSVATHGGNAGSYAASFGKIPGCGFPGLAFESDASNLVSGDSNGQRDIFYASDFGGVTRASVKSGGAQAAGGACRNASIHLAGADALVAFESDMHDLVSQLDPMTTTNAYLYANRGGIETTSLLNARADENGVTPGRADHGVSPASSFRPRLSADGESVAFETLADDLDVFRPFDQNHALDVVLTDLRYFRESGALRHRRVSLTPSGGDASGPSMLGASGRFQGTGTISLGAHGQPQAFADALATKVLHPRCVNCHGINAPSPTLPNHNVGQNCNGCHDPNFTGVPSWSGPPPELDFRGKSIAELCRIAIDSPLGHLENDPRLRWALTNGLIPDGQGGSQLAAGGTVPGGLAIWLDQVADWRASGMKCSDASANGGEFVAFRTQASNLGAPSGGDVSFLGLLDAAATERISKPSGFPPFGGTQASAPSGAASISANDRYVAFETTAALDENDGNGKYDIYVRDLFLGATTLVSRTAGSYATANGASRNPSISVSSGSVYVAFESTATNLVAGFADHNGSASDVYVARVVVTTPGSSTIALVSRGDGNTTQGGNGASSNASAGGANAGAVSVAFESTATDLTSGFVDHNGASGTDVYLVTDPLGAAGIELVSASAPGQGGNGSSRRPVAHDSASWVAFESQADDLFVGFTDHNGAAGSDVFLRDLNTSATLLLSGSAGSGTDGGDASSGSARLDANDPPRAFFESQASDLVGGFVDNNLDGFDVYVRDPYASPMLALISASRSGATNGGNGSSRRPSASFDGTQCAFESLADDLVDASVDADTNAASDVFVRGLSSLQTRRASRGPGGVQGDGASLRASIGVKVVAFESSATDLVGPGVDTNGASDVFRADL